MTSRRFGGFGGHEQTLPGLVGSDLSEPDYIGVGEAEKDRREAAWSTFNKSKLQGRLVFSLKESCFRGSHILSRCTRSLFFVFQPARLTTRATGNQTQMVTSPMSTTWMILRRLCTLQQNEKLEESLRSQIDFTCIPCTGWRYMWLRSLASPAAAIHCRGQAEGAYYIFIFTFIMHIYKFNSIIFVSMS